MYLIFSRDLAFFYILQLKVIKRQHKKIITISLFAPLSIKFTQIILSIIKLKSLFIINYLYKNKNFLHEEKILGAFWNKAKAYLYFYIGKYKNNIFSISKTICT